MPIVVFFVQLPSPKPGKSPPPAPASYLSSAPDLIDETKTRHSAASSSKASDLVDYTRTAEDPPSYYLATSDLFPHC